MFYDLTFLVIFSIAVAIFLYARRHKLKRDGILFLYKTKIGLKVIDTISKKYPRTLKALSYVIVVTGYLLMLASFYLLFQLISVFMNPEFVKLIKVPPIMPLIPYLPNIFQITWLPPFYITYWIIAIALVAITHEGFHGIFARFYRIRIKSTGFGFLGPLLAFFVEQDDKQMQKAKRFSQMTVLGAGVFANVICAIIFGLLMLGFLNAAYAPQGVVFNDYIYSAVPFSALANSSLAAERMNLDGVNFSKIILDNKAYFVPDKIFDANYSKNLKNGTLVKLYWDEPAIRSLLKGAIIKINEIDVVSTQNISDEISKFKPGDKITLTTKYREGKNTTIINYSITLGKDYGNKSRAIIGTATLSPAPTTFRGILYRLMSYFRDPTVNYEPKFNEELTIFVYNLMLWLVLISFSVAVTNMLPLGIFDGGRFFYLTILAITKKEKIAEKAFKWMTWLLLGVVALLMVLWFIGMQ
jgi:membrane-associated protease RseP (regulator of RpoE activity)